jgi:ABC-2 type transport system permease protein
MSTFPTLLWLRFRRDRVQIAVWILLFVVLEVVAHAAVTETYGDEAEREGVIRLVILTPAILMLRGTPQGTQPDAFQYFLLFGFLGLMAGLMSTFLAVRHSRADEESGRAELIGSTEAGRITPLLATTSEGIILNVVIGALVGGVALAYGAGPLGALLHGAALAAVGIAYLGVGLACAQIMRTSRGANGLASAIVTLGYLLRAFGDATGTVQPDGLSMEAGWASWLSPIGWGQAVAPYTHQNAWPLLLCLGLAGVLLAVSIALQSSRDLDSGIIPERSGRLHAPRTLAGPLGLAWRLLRNPVIGWVVGGALFGAFLGAVVALVFAILPRLSIGLGWAVVLAAVVFGQLGGLFGFPDWLRDVSPFTHTPVVTAAEVDWTAAWVMLAIAVAGGALSLVLLRRRDLALGG